MSDEDSDATERAARAQREADRVAIRVKERAERPISGRFDTAHLRAVHAYLFQDLRGYQPGGVRADADGWHKARELEGRGPSHG